MSGLKHWRDWLKKTSERAVDRGESTERARRLRSEGFLADYVVEELRMVPKLRAEMRAQIARSEARIRREMRDAQALAEAREEELLAAFGDVLAVVRCYDLLVADGFAFANLRR
jgi:hypothetical protein